MQLRSVLFLGILAIFCVNIIAAMDVSPVVRLASGGNHCLADHAGGSQLQHGYATPEAVPSAPTRAAVYMRPVDDFPCPFQVCPCRKYRRHCDCTGCWQLCYKCCCMPCMIHELGKSETVGCHDQSVLPPPEPVCCGCNWFDSLFWKMICCYPCIKISRSCGDKKGEGGE